MDFAEIIQIISKTEASDEDALVEALRSAEKDEGTIHAAVSIYRTMSAFADSLSYDDLAAIGKSLEITPVDEIVEEVVEEVEKADDTAEEEVTEEAVVEEVVEKTEEIVEEVVETEVVEEEVSKSEDDERITALQAEIASLREDKTRRDLLKMVEGLRVGKTEDELVEVLLNKDAADVEAIVDTWKTASIAVESALTEIGSDMPGVVSNDVYQEAEAEVNRIAKDEGVSVTKAWNLLGDRNPALLKKYYEEN